MDRTHVFVISLHVFTGILTEIAAYTTLDEHDHIDVGQQLEFYAHMFQHGVPREIWQYNNARDRDSNSRLLTQLLRKFSKNVG